MAVLAGSRADRVAVATLPALVVGMPPATSGGFAAVPTGTVQLAIVPFVQATTVALTTRSSVALLPVSVVPLMKRWSVVLV